MKVEELVKNTDFFEAMKQQSLEENNISITENGAVGYATTGDKLTDLHFAVSSLRNASASEIEDKFMSAYLENPRLAILWLFYVRDVREGLGERRLFRVCLAKALNVINTKDVKLVTELCGLIPEYGRWDDLYVVFKKYPVVVGNYFAERLAKDAESMLKNQPVSLLAKWLKSENASSAETRSLAKATAHYMGLTPRQYRQVLSSLRKYIDVTECKLSERNYSEINYESVPSQASLKYKEAFKRNDSKRYAEYLESVSKGEKKINANTLYPCDIVHNYIENGWAPEVKDVDKTLEELWKALPDTVNGDSSVMVVADGSGSMTSKCNANSSISALDVANSLAIYFAERATGAYKNKYITFSNKPQFVDFTSCRTLRDKIMLALEYDEMTSTNIEKVFDLILSTAIKYNLKQNEIPEAVLIISDMEFNYAMADRYSEEKLFRVITEKFINAGYQLPKLIFWNVNSRTNTIPIRENANGLVLVSGYSINTMKMILNGELDPKKALYKEITSERYAPVDSLIQKIIE